ncbi:hypothetical protein P3W45_000944 [Vairimorpha bombi]
MSSLQELRDYLVSKKEYLNPPEFMNLLSLFDKMKFNEDNEYINLKEEADLHYRKGNYTSAADLYTKYLDGRISSVILNNRSACFHKLQMYDECLDDCLRGLEIDDKYVKFYVRISLVKMDQDNKEEAEGWIKKGLEVDESNKILKELLNKL